jgi:DNA-binding response OmpR family regulator
MPNEPVHILVVDDELPIRITMGDLLRRRGYIVETAANGQEALDLIYQRSFAVMLFDLKMPGMSGLEVAQRAHERQPDAALIILTGHGSLESAMEGIQLGIFDYMLKTTSPREVVERVQAAVTRQQEDQRRKQLLGTLHSVVSELHGQTAAPSAQPAPSEGWITVGDLQLSTWKQQARLGDQALALTPTEFRMLVCLAQQAGQVMSYQQIIRCTQSYEAEPLEAAELVKPHIYHLRQKIEPDPSNPRYLLTVRGVGYMLAAAPDSRPAS